MNNINNNLFRLENFIIVAEELNLGSAARKAFISPQGMSKYIMRLEESLDVKLFNREPKLSLTPAGEILYNYAIKLRQIHEDMNTDILRCRDGVLGELRFGIPYGRAFGILPNILKPFMERYPKIDVRVEMDMPTSDMRRALEDGTLDLVMCLDFKHNPHLSYRSVLVENTYVVVTDEILKTYYQEENIEKKRLQEEGIDLRMCGNMPFIVNPAATRTNQMIRDYLKRENIEMHFNVVMNCAELQISCCDVAACFCSQFDAKFIQEHNLSRRKDNQINMFPLVGLKSASELRVVYLKDRYLPDYVKYFITLIEDYVGQNYIETI